MSDDSKPYAEREDVGRDLARSEEMKTRGFTGAFCPECGGCHMVRAGTCECCQDCGATTGCS